MNVLKRLYKTELEKTKILGSFFKNIHKIMSKRINLEEYLVLDPQE